MPYRLLSAMKNLLLLLAVLGVMSGCRKAKVSPAPSPIHIDSALAAAYDYKVGTYWVFKDSVGGGTDSLYVATNTSQNNFQDIFLYDVKIGSTDTNIWGIHLVNSAILIHEISSIPLNLDLAYLNFYAFPIANRVSDTVYDGISAKTTIITGNSLTLNSINYDKVIIASINGSGPTHRSIYLNSNVGFLKIVRNDSFRVFGSPDIDTHQVLELQRYNLVK